jgi:hypothetical protein
VDVRKRLVEQAEKLLFAIYKKIRNDNIPIDLQLKLFDSLVEPIIKTLVLLTLTVNFHLSQYD